MYFCVEYWDKFPIVYHGKCLLENENINRFVGISIAIRSNSAQGMELYDKDRALQCENNTILQHVS